MIQVVGVVVSAVVELEAEPEVVLEVLDRLVLHIQGIPLIDNMTPMQHYNQVEQQILVLVELQGLY